MMSHLHDMASNPKKKYVEGSECGKKVIFRSVTKLLRALWKKRGK